NNASYKLELYKTTLANDGFTIAAAMFGKDGTNELKAHWDGRIQDGTASLRFSGGDSKVEALAFALSRFTQHDGVLEGDNVHVRRVIKALDEIETVLLREDRSFRERAGEKLWPPAQDDDGKLDVFAELPWVLFARRRTEDCACDDKATAKRRF